jgi:hypothetical protein
MAFHDGFSWMSHGFSCMNIHGCNIDFIGTVMDPFMNFNEF